MFGAASPSLGVLPPANTCVSVDLGAYSHSGFTLVSMGSASQTLTCVACDMKGATGAAGVWRSCEQPLSSPELVAGQMAVL